MKEISLKQGTDEWLQFKKGKIGASFAPKIMGVCKFDTPYSLWQLILGYRQDIDNPFKRHGRELEEEARTVFEEETGIFVDPVVGIHDNHPWMMASFDGMTIDRKELVEIKCPKSSDNLIVDGIVCEMYYPQLQHQMCVAGLDKAHFWVYRGKDNFEHTICQRDDQFIDMMIKMEMEFLDFLQTNIPPPLTERDYMDMSQNPEWESLALQYQMYTNDIKALEIKIEANRKKLIDLSADRNCRGCGITVSKVSRKGNIDYSKIPELSRVDLDRYRKPSSDSWRIYCA